MAYSCTLLKFLYHLALLGVLVGFEYGSVASQIGLGSRLLARDNKAWVSDNGTFAFGFTPMENGDYNKLQLAIWFAKLPGDRTVVWSPNKDSPVTKNAILELNNAGNLILSDGRATTIWASNTSGAGVEAATMSESGNFILYNDVNRPVWQSFSHPSDTLLPNQPLSVKLELTTSKSDSSGSYYALKMLQQPTSLSLALTYNLPETFDSSPDSYANYSYWQGPDISNVTGDIRELVENKILVLEYVETSKQIADIFTKALDSVGFISLRKSLGVCQEKLSTPHRNIQVHQTGLCKLPFSNVVVQKLCVQAPLDE